MIEKQIFTIVNLTVEDNYRLQIHVIDASMCTMYTCVEKVVEQRLKKLGIYPSYGSKGGYGSGDETSTLLAKAAKPVLMRQDCTTTLIVSPTPHLSASGGLMGASDESGVLPQQDEGARSVPDIEMHCRTRGPNHLVPHR
ncbi:unnamed protein product [Nesidiocoris tenuis]|uniref:Uncharacterized protein n=1 Tax=Nesidiocoris tenuis TaxID=355587 RepID=A0A6H5G9I2_9HEMI|nr:unnamed protein product [Nesidiocoris tenuis]